MPAPECGGTEAVVGEEEVLDRMRPTAAPAVEVTGDQPVDPRRVVGAAARPLRGLEHPRSRQGREGVHSREGSHRADHAAPVGCLIMRIARFTTGEEPQYGVIGTPADRADGAGEDEPGGADMVAALVGDPLYQGIEPTGERLPLDEVRLLAPVIPRSKVVCVGRNYADHAAEMGSDLPEEPLLFLKPNTSVVGPHDPVTYPRQSSEVHYEGELAVVIRRICRDVPAERARDVIFGYTVGNDVTARDLQKKDVQFTRAKGFDSFCPLGPWVETDLDPSDLEITTTVNGEVRQRGRTSQLIFDVPTLIAYITSVMTLLPGDVVLTGTPAGVGPMHPGDDVAVTVQGIGTLSNKVVSRD
jgi:2-keto-4-pentenoate hydratase/2-oxohepta-3-ene-1,7-dioic acid hydratase in catechol pathway